MIIFPSRQGIRFLLHFLSTRRREFSRIFVLDLLANAGLIAASWVLAQLLAALFGFHSVRAGILHLPQWPAQTWAATLGGILWFRWMTDYGRVFFRTRLAEDFAHYLRVRAFEHYLSAEQPLRRSGAPDRGLLRFSGDLAAAQRLLTHGVVQFSADLTLLLVAWACIASMSIQLALVLFALGACAWLFLHRFNRKLRETEKKRRSRKSALLAFVSQTLQQLPAIHVLNRQPRMSGRFLKKSEKVRMAGRNYAPQMALSVASASFFPQILLLLSLLIGLQLKVPAATLFVAALVLLACRPAFTRLLRADLIWKKGSLSLEKITANCEEAPRVRKNIGPRQLRIQNLSLAPGNRPLFQHFNLELNVGEIKRLQLPPAGGKTSLVRWLTGWTPAEEGQLYFDDTPASSLGLRVWRKQIAVVSDAFPLAGQNIGDALAPENNPDSTQKARLLFEAWQSLFPVLQALTLDDSLTHLSGSQLRILQFLRAFLAEKPFLILDEPSDHLDAASASTLLEQLERRRSKTGLLLLSSQTNFNAFKKNALPAVTSFQPCDIP
jgi:ABC-type multidrug transport system fused ATPase/permease subunit